MKTLLDSIKYYLRTTPVFYIAVIVLLFSQSHNSLSAEQAETNLKTDIQQNIDQNQSNLSGIQNTNPESIGNSIDNLSIIQETLDALRQEVANSKEKTITNRNRVQTIRDGLALIESKLQEAYSGLDESRGSIVNNQNNISELEQDLMESKRNIRANTSDLNSQKSLIEENSIRLYEMLIRINTIRDQAQRLAESLDNAQNADTAQEMRQSISSDVNQLWQIVATVLVFFSPVAFVISSNRENYKPLVDGIAQHQGVLIAFIGAFFGYFLIGFGLMYGESGLGLIGTTNYLLEPTNSNTDTIHSTSAFHELALYRSGFAVLAAMIVYTIIGRQLSSFSHLIVALLVGTLLVPIFGHWVWSGTFIPNNKGWLEGAGFIDQAGSISIHMVAAWFAFILVLRLKHEPVLLQQDNKISDDPVYSSSATLLLWISWLGLTTGTLLVSSEKIPTVMLNVSLAGIAGGLATFTHHAFSHNDKSRIMRTLAGFMSGLVAIAACAQSVTFIEALVIGVIAGLLQNIMYNSLRKFFLKQAWQAKAAYLIAIHGFAGIWGGLCVALFGTENTFNTPDFIQLVTQVQGIVVALAYSIFMGHTMLYLLTFYNRKAKHKEAVP